MVSDGCAVNVELRMTGMVRVVSVVEVQNCSCVLHNRDSLDSVACRKHEGAEQNLVMVEDRVHAIRTTGRIMKWSCPMADRAYYS